MRLTPKASGDRKTMPEPGIILEVLKKLDLDIAYSSEKLLNLDLCITDMSLGENDPRVFSTEKGCLSDEQSEKALALDLSLSYLGSEVIELGNFLDSLQVDVVNVYEKISLFQSEPELAMLFEESLRRLEVSLKPLQQKLLEMTKQLGILQRIRSFGQNSSYTFDEVFKMKIPDMLVSSELDFDNKLAEFKRNEDELKSKLLMADRRVSSIETTAELTWLRLLEAENLAEVFKGTSSEMIMRFQALQFSLNGSLQREAELKCQLQACHEQLQETKTDKTDTYGSQINALKEKVKLLEVNLEFSESKLRQANASKEANDQTIFEMENLVLSMREDAFTAESRAEVAEAKVVELTEANTELTEELGFLKGTENNTEKISLLEKQVRDLEKQLQRAKASSEASLEQQNMLYTAIWDMETLIEDLKSKASKAEVRSENTEDKCLKLAETNSELHREISCLKSRAETLEASLKDVNRRKGASAKDINSGAKIISDMVMQLALERERIQKQIVSITRENTILMEELRKSKKKALAADSSIIEENDHVKEACSAVKGLTSIEGESVILPETSCTSNQVSDSLDDVATTEHEECSSTSPDNKVTDALRRETVSPEQGEWYLRRRYILMVILMPVVAASAILVICTEEKFAALRQRIGL